MKTEIILGLVGLAIIIVLLLIIIFYNPKEPSPVPLITTQGVGGICNNITECNSGLTCEIGYCVIPLGGSCSANTNSCIGGVECISGMCGTGIDIVQLTNIQIPEKVIPIPIQEIAIQENLIEDEILLSNMQNVYNVQPPMQQPIQPQPIINTCVDTNQYYQIPGYNKYMLEPCNNVNPYLLNPVVSSPVKVGCGIY